MDICETVDATKVAADCAQIFCEFLENDIRELAEICERRVMAKENKRRLREKLVAKQ